MKSNRKVLAVADMIKTIPQDSTLDDILHSLLSEFDGPTGYARHVRAVFDSSQEGGVTQQKILDLIGNLLSRKASIDKNVQTDYSQMSDEEIDLFMEAYMGGPQNGAAPASDS